jgi:hypothetical protein
MWILELTFVCCNFNLNVTVVEGQSHTITCSISGISDITGITWIKTSATGDKIAIVVGEDGKFSGGTLSDP